MFHMKILGKHYWAAFYILSLSFPHEFHYLTKVMIGYLAVSTLPGTTTNLYPYSDSEGFHS